MFGFNTVSLDSKGRLLIPARYRSKLKLQKSNQIVITKDPQYPSLKVYPGKEWIELSTKLEGKSGLQRAGRQVTPGRRESTDSATENIPPINFGKGEMVG